MPAPKRPPPPDPRTFRRRRLGVLAAFLALVTVVVVAARGGGGGTSARPALRQASAPRPVAPLAPGAFAPGACMVMAPTRGDRHLTVFLDAGHGGIDPGGLGTTESGATIHEADLTLPIELDAAGLLRGQGFEVVVSRTGDSSVVRLTAADVSQGALTLQGAHDDVAARDICANDAHAAALVGIYFDAGASASNAGSVTGYDAARTFSAANLRLATLVQHDVLGAMNAQGWGIPDEGVLPDSGLGSSVPTQSDSPLAEAAAGYDHLLLLGPAQPGYFTTPSQMPGAVVEPLYITDPFEGSLADSSSGQRVIAGALAQAVEQYLAPPPPAPSSPTTFSSTSSSTSSTGAGG